MPRRGPLAILLADDDPDDVALIRDALADVGCGDELHAVGNGEELLARLRSVPAQAWPDLVLLDLNMPRMDGRRALRELRADPALRQIPIVVLTTSAAPRDAGRCDELGASAVLTKPASFERLVELLGLLGTADLRHAA